jgi:predicted CXXCH cytochrome family protein
MRLLKTFPLVITFLSFGLLLLSNNVYSEENPCVTCHSDFKKPAKSVHAAMGLGCSSCHKTIEGKTHPADKGSIILTQNMPGLCYSCHEETKFKGKSVHQPVSGGMCTACHNAHQSNNPKLLIKDSPTLCFDCHKDSKFKGGKSGHTNIGMCTGCHNPHASNSEKILKMNQPELCYNCHDKAKFTKKYIHGIIPKGGCTVCHTPHISNYPSLLTSNISEGCVTCHLSQSKGQHVTAAVRGSSKRKYHPVSGATDPRFPGTKKKIPDPNKPGHEIEVYDPEHPGKLITCASCHDPHSSDYRHLFPAANVCQLCHAYF